ARKYGSDRVAQIITFGTMGAKAAIRDVGRALGMSYGDTDRIAKMIPFAVGMTIENALDETKELQAACAEDEQIQTLVDTSRRLEGVARHSSTHAAGLVISRGPLVEHVPLQLPPRADVDKADALPTTQFAMNQVAEIGLLKLDVLGLTNLTILGRAVDLIRELRGVDIDLQALPDDDAKTFEMLAKGETFGVFQLESGGMRRSIQELRPSTISDLAAMVALYRPGPMQHITTFCNAKNGITKITYPHDDLAGILDETYGVITYQDQVLLIAQKFAGYTLGEADVMRKAMGKKDAEVMHAERENFVRGAKRNGYSEGDAQEIFELILPFAGYAFNKAHAVCYAMIAYQTGYLKMHYPAEYMVAVLGYASSQPAGGQSRIAAAAAECARLGIEVIPPDVNESRANFSLEQSEGEQGEDGESIRFGLRQIKNVGAGAAESIVKERDDNGTFESLEDFCRRIDLKTVNKRALESLAKAGALAPFGSRATLLANLERIMSLAQREQRLRETGQSTMFDLFGDEVNTPMPALELEEASVPRKEELDWEKELLGLYVSEHPFKAAASVLGPFVTAQCGELEAESAPAGNGNGGNEGEESVATAALPPKGRLSTVAGVVGNTRRLYTRDGRPFCAAAIEDLSGIVEVTVWPELFEKTQDVWIEGNIVLLEVRVRERNSRINIAVQRVETFDPETETTSFVPPTWLTKAKKKAVVTSGFNSPTAQPSVPATTTPAAPAPPAVPAASTQIVPPPPEAPLQEPDAPPRQAPDAPEPQAAVATVSRVAGLRVELRETDDEDADRDRLERLLAVLADHGGDEDVRLTVHTLDGQSQGVKLGKVRVSIDGELLTELSDVLGDAGSVTA
ncbi:MAG: DNA polymerase III subunit alpha, partial [Chloroflexi bacterium]|nr:DNA polymerase III subunit alpha [Chloroflexota bacterium]